MGIRSKFDGDFKAINLAGMADDMLAQVVADHAADQFRPSNRANAVVAGEFVAYSVSVNGRTVHRGKGEIFPQRQLQVAIHPPGAMARARTRMPVILIDWAWESLQPGALQRALKNITRVSSAIDTAQDALSFARALATNDRSGLLRLLLEVYAKRQYPAVFARFGQAKALYRVYRLVHLAGGLIGSSDKSDSGPSVLAWIAKELRSRSPVQSGAYRDAHALYADGRPLMAAAAVTEDARLPEAEEFSFANTVPYARKIEFGKTQSGRDFVVQVPNHIYERVAKDAAQRFRGVAEIQYEVRAVIDAHQTPQRHAWRPHNRPAVRYPSIVVRF